jgi:hypothetical protein
MSAAIKPEHISDQDWQQIVKHATHQGAAITETNQAFWEAEYFRVKEEMGEA